MAERICKNCGAPIDDGATECRYCRTPVGATPNMVNNSYSQGNAFNNRQGRSDEEEHKIHAVVAYLGILVLIPIFAAPGSEFAKFHANQGLVLFLTSIISTVVFGFLPNWFIFKGLHSLISIGVFALMIVGIINAVNGERKELPVIGSIKILK